VIRSSRALLVLAAATAAILAPGCGGAADEGADTVPAVQMATVPDETTPPVQTVTGDPAELSGKLCADFRDQIGSIPTPQGKEEEAQFEEQVAAAEQSYLEGLRALPVPEKDRAGLDEFVAAQEELFRLQKEVRAQGEAGAGEGGPAMDAAAEAEKLGTKLGLTGCALI
jgi:hypothetical protein